MDKNKFLNHKLLSKSNIAIIISLFMILGFLVSRPINALGTILFGINALRGINPKRWLKEKWWLLGLAWVALYALTYFWSKDLHSWHERLDQKLPFLLLPLAFAYLPPFTAKQLQVFTGITALMMLAGTGYSTYFYVAHTAHYLENYFYSSLLPTPAENDHICFSMALAVFIAWCIYILPYLKGRLFKWFIIVTILLLSAYLHLLSAKSGLIAWYILILGYSLYLGIRKSKLLGLGMVLLLVTTSIFAVRYFPTLKARIWYVRYTYHIYEQGEDNTNFSDMGRIISYDVATRLIKEHPITGVGAGDILEAMKSGYSKWYPDVKDEQRLFPHNQFLTVALGCGIPAALFFIVWLIYPLFKLKRNRGSFFFIIVWLMLLLPLMVEPFLEIQFGVFVYLFFLLWQRQVSIHEPVAVISE